MKGIINIHKPRDFTSHDCVAIVRRIVGIKRVGHTGTLDPMATGVLPICIGPATRIMEYLDHDQKEYRCTMELGTSTDTCDIWGNVLGRKQIDHLTRKKIRDAFLPFSGKITQVPPMYSAVKVKGKKLYEYARIGVEVEIKPRTVTIHALEVEEIQGGEITFRVVCSKGTYIRSICRDVGESLGVGGAMSGLIRLASGAFRIEDAIEMGQLRKMSSQGVAAIILPTDYPLVSYQKLEIDRERALDFIHGKRIRPAGGVGEGKTRIYYNDIFLGMAAQTEKKGELKPDKIFHTEI